MILGTLSPAGELRAIEIWRAELTMREPFEASHGLVRSRPVLYVRVVTDQGEGWGEVAAMDTPVGTDASLSAVLHTLEVTWVPRLFAAADSRAALVPPSATIGSLGPHGPADRMAAAALEMAVLDAELRGEEVSLAHSLGVKDTSVAFGAVIGIPEDRSIETTQRRVHQVVSEGASRVRLKIARGFSVEPARAALEVAGSLDVHVDANGAFDPADAPPGSHNELTELDALGLRCIEQPIAGVDLAAMHRLANRLATDLCLDETIATPRVARDALRYGACEVLCIKPGRLGGIRAAWSVLDMALEDKAGAFIGGMFESGLGRAVTQVLALHPAATLVSDVSAPRSYLAHDPCDLVGPNGVDQPVWQQPGVGPWPSHHEMELLSTFTG